MNVKNTNLNICYLCFVIILSFVLCNLSLALAVTGYKPRYISLAPSTTEILFALGLSDNIVGVSSYCNYPAETKNREKIGDFSHPNIEKIIFLKPDYIFCTGLEQAPVIEELRRLKFNVYVADPSGIEGLLKTIQNIGAITHKEEEAQALIGMMKADIEIIRRRASSVPPERKVKVFVEIWHDPLMTAGSGSFVDEMITLAGGINVAHDVPRPYCYFSAEKVISLNPDVIIMTYMDKQPPLKLVESRFGWGEIEAVKNKQVFNDIDPDELLRPGPRITEGLKRIQDKLYPKNG
ncbi:MAG: cobalamin-binding protein [Candidatus Omnitrophica bacterium]|nr:cobalamin-binding protein [Candidatus Omnitrophota bacterium]